MAGSEGEEHFAKWFGPRVNLWQFIKQRDHEPWKQLVLLARYILTLKPVLVRTYSAHVARYIFNGALTGMFRSQRHGRLPLGIVQGRMGGGC